MAETLYQLKVTLLDITHPGHGYTSVAGAGPPGGDSVDVTWLVVSTYVPATAELN